MMVLPLPSGLIASPLPCEPVERIWPPALIVMVQLLRNSTVSPLVLYRPGVLTPLFCTSAPLEIVIFALSATLIAFASPTTTCAFGSKLTVVPVAVLGPEPIVLVQGFGALLSTVMLVPLVTKLALAFHGKAADAIASNATAQKLRRIGTPLQWRVNKIWLHAGLLLTVVPE